MKEESIRVNHAMQSSKAYCYGTTLTWHLYHNNGVWKLSLVSTIFLWPQQPSSAFHCLTVIHSRGVSCPFTSGLCCYTMQSLSSQLVYIIHSDGLSNLSKCQAQTRQM